jgi:hypothetical protein
MADAISLYLDISLPQGRLIKGLTDAAPFVLGPFYQGQLLKLRVYPVTVSGSAVAPTISKVSLTNLDLQVAVGPRAGSEAIKASQYTWTKQSSADTDGESGYFYADLNLNTTDLNTAIGTADTYATYFEFLISRSGGSYTPAHQVAVNILAVVKDPGGAASNPTPAVEYFTKAQVLELFVLWDNRTRSANNGRSIITVSPDGTHTRESVGVDNDGAPTDNLT